MMMTNETVMTIESAIGYTFRNKALLMQAFTRPSYVNEHKGALDYQILEYCGDKFLSVAVNTVLFETFTVETERGLMSSLKEGDFSAHHAALTNKNYLAERMRTLSFGELLLMSEGDRKCGTYNEDSVLEDLLESIVGAIAFDSGCHLASINTFVRRVLDIEAYVKGTNGKARISAKNDLQELLQGAGYALPEYLSEDNPDGTFTVTCYVKDLSFETSAIGKSKREAERLAAADAVAKLSADLSVKRTQKQHVGVTGEKDPVSSLQELCQKNHLPMPIYREENEVVNPDNTHLFTVSVEVNGLRAFGEGSSKKEAKRLAAADAVAKLSADLSAKRTQKQHVGVTAVKDPVSSLQELCQKNYFPMPSYREENEVVNPDNTHLFTVSVEVNGLRAFGEGSSKKEAKRMAALRLDMLLRHPDKKGNNSGFYLDDADFYIREGVLVTYKKNDSSVTVPEGVVAIGEEAFMGKSTLEVVHLPDSLRSIERHAFSGCHKLSSLVFPEGITNFGYGAFSDCTSLTSVEIPKGVRTLHSALFSGCSNLKTAILSKNTKILASTFPDETNILRVDV